MPPKAAEKTATATKPAHEPRVAEPKAADGTRVVSPTRQRDLDAAISTITKTYGDVVALDRVDLRVQPGTVAARLMSRHFG